MTINKPVRLGIVGGGRGGAYWKSIDLLPEQVELVAFCDQNPEVFGRWKERYPALKTYTDLGLLLDDDEVDAVYLATPLMVHAEQAVRVMEAGKHVLCEVSAAHTIEGCWELVQAQENTGRIYMMAENFCYLRSTLLVANMVEQGAFGELTHAECGYVHDVRNTTHGPDGSLKWRGELLRDYNGANYPTHSLGPVAQWLGINRGDAFDYMVTIASRPSSQAAYFGELFGKEHPGAKPDFWKQGDSVLCLIRTKQGTVIYFRNDFSSPRPWNYLYSGLQGTRGVFESGRDIKEAPVAWLREAGDPPVDGGRAFKPLWDYAPRYEHPLWQKYGETAMASGNFGEYFVLQEFATAIQEGRSPAMDVYDSVAISSVFPLSAESIAKNGEPVKFPDFAQNKQRTQDVHTNDLTGLTG